MKEHEIRVSVQSCVVPFLPEQFSPQHTRERPGGWRTLRIQLSGEKQIDDQFDSSLYWIDSVAWRADRAGAQQRNGAARSAIERAGCGLDRGARDTRAHQSA